MDGRTQNHGPGDDEQNVGTYAVDLCDFCGKTEDECNATFHMGIGKKCENAECPACKALQAKDPDRLCGVCGAEHADREIDRVSEAG